MCYSIDSYIYHFHYVMMFKNHLFLEVTFLHQFIVVDDEF